MDEGIVIKLCECGCGRPTAIADSSCKRRGRVRGYGMRFIKGHGFKGRHHTEKAKASIKSGMSGVGWKGDNICKAQGNCRAIKLYPILGKCELCECDATDRHHKDGNTLNNEPSNVQRLCRKHHIFLDGRLANLKSFMNGGNRVIEAWLIAHGEKEEICTTMV
jgi:hypothetical protein